MCVVDHADASGEWLQGREDLCRTYLGEDRTLRDLQKHVVVTAFKLDGKVWSDM